MSEQVSEKTNEKAKVQGSGAANGSANALANAPVKVQATENTPEKAMEKAPAKVKKPRKKIKIKWSTVILLALIGGGGYWYFTKESSAPTVASEYIEETVTKQDISVTISATGTLKAADSYNVTSLVKGEILAAPFEEGDVIEKDSVLFQIDSSDVESTIERSELSLERNQITYNEAAKNLADLEIKATESGVITKLYVKEGDDLPNGGKIADIQEREHMKLTVSVNTADMGSIYEGQSAEITIDGSFETLSGVVDKIAVVDSVLPSGAIVRDVTLRVKNPGGLSSSLYATANIGGVAATGGGRFAYYDVTTVTAGMAGKVESLFCKEGQQIAENDILLNLSSSTLETQIKNNDLSLQDAKLSLDSSKKQLENYQITAPITGTVIEKKFKAGDKIDSSNGGTMAVIFDLTSLNFDMNIDELDISKVKMGQKVTVTSDAVKGKVYIGEISKISINGTSSNGVTTYPVTVTIAETEGLLPGMNINAEVVVEEKTGVLAVPVSAVARGNTVMLKTGGTTSAPVVDGTDTTQNPAAANPDTGYTSTPVEVGINNDNYIEILSGLKEGDVIRYTKAKSSSNDIFGMGMMGGGTVTMAPMAAAPSGGGKPRG